MGKGIHEFMILCLVYIIIAFLPLQKVNWKEGELHVGEQVGRLCQAEA